MHIQSLKVHQGIFILFALPSIFSFASCGRPQFVHRSGMFSLQTDPSKLEGRYVNSQTDTNWRGINFFWESIDKPLRFKLSQSKYDSTNSTVDLKFDRTDRLVARLYLHDKLMRTVRYRGSFDSVGFTAKPKRSLFGIPLLYIVAEKKQPRFSVDASGNVFADVYGYNWGMVILWGGSSKATFAYPLRRVQKK